MTFGLPIRTHPPGYTEESTMAGGDNDKKQAEIDGVPHLRKEPRPDFSDPPKAKKLPKSLQAEIDREETLFDSVYEGRLVMHKSRLLGPFRKLTCSTVPVSLLTRISVMLPTPRAFVPSSSRLIATLRTLRTSVNRSDLLRIHIW